MSKTTTPPTMADKAAAPKPKGWLARAFGIGGASEAAPTRPFDFAAMHQSLTSLERKSKSAKRPKGE